MSQEHHGDNQIFRPRPVFPVDNSLNGLTRENKLASYDTLGNFVDFLNENSFDDTNGFSTSNNVNQETSESKNSEEKSAYQYIESCIPKWKQIFPWVSWCQEGGVLLCLHCREVLKKFFPHLLEKCNIISVSACQKVHLYAKKLREHHDSTSHASSIYLFSYRNLLAFVSLFCDHYKDMKLESEVLETVRSMFNYSKLEKESLVSTIKSIGKYLEDTLLVSLRQSVLFSVVADQCRGIIILKWLTNAGKAEEHILWSYLSVWDKTPLQYLEKLNVSFSNMSIYIANSSCQQCKRCQSGSVTLAALPPRPPSTLSFAIFLWNLSFLSPLNSLINTVYKLWRAYPYKFAEKLNCQDFKGLFGFHTKPSCLIPILQNFDTIKKISREIYESHSHVEVLGLTLINVTLDEKHKKILTLLQEIMDIIKEVSKLMKITDDQIAKLNQTYSSLKMCSMGANFVTSEYDAVSKCEKSHSDKILEFLQFVEKFVDEHQKTLYYNGRESVLAFFTICNTDMLLDGERKIKEAVFSYAFSVVYKFHVASRTKVTSKALTYESVKNFHSYLIQKNRKVATSSDIISLFYNESHLQMLYSEAFGFFQFCASMPFMTCHIERSLFVSFVIEQRLESSVWVRMEADIKPWLLYLHHELHCTSEKELLEWWVKSL